jgi:hypothetical membrane protein
MRRRALGSATLAPIALIGGWALAQSRQPSGYDATRDTISALAAHGATDRWIMTTGLAVLGACHLITASGVPEAGARARIALAVGGLATIGVAVYAQPSSGHAPAAATAFVALSVWPAAWLPPRRRAGAAVSLVLIAVLVWFGYTLDHEALKGLSERILAGAQALAPLGFVLAVRFEERRASGRRAAGRRTAGRRR